MHWTVLLLLCISQLCTTLAAEACAPPSNLVIRGVEDPRVEWRTQRLIDSHPNTPNTDKVSLKVNFTELLALDGIELRRIEHAWLDYFRRAGDGELAVRYKVMETIGQIYGLYKFEEELDKEQKKSSNFTDVNGIAINEVINSAKKNFEVKSLELYSNCSTWLEMLEADWQQYLRNKNDSVNETLVANLALLRDKARKQHFLIFKATLLERAKSGNFPLEIGAKVLANQQRFFWISYLFKQHLDWLAIGQMTLPFNSDKCVIGRLVPAALDLAQRVIDAKRDFLLQHEKFIVIMGKNEMMQKTSESLQNLVKAQKQFTKTLQSYEDQLHNRLLLGREMSRLEALIELQRRVMSRSEFYYNQASTDYFQQPLSPFAIESALEDVESEMELAIRKHTHKCVLWSEMLDGEWTSYRASATGANETTIRETFQVLQRKATELKSRVVKLRQEVPDEFSRYLRPETEFELIAAEKQYERLALEFGGYVKRAQK